METAKVDIRKLQLLNDCINRTIEALNQVRLSVHAGGIQHSAQMGLQGLQGLGTPGYYGGFPGSYPGAYTSPFGISPQQAGMVPGFAQVGALGGYPQGFGANVAGIGHSGLDPRLAWDWQQQNDPYTTARLAQTFPFVHWGQSPFAWPNV